MRLNFALLSEPMQKSAGTLGTPGTASNGKDLTRPQTLEKAGDTRGQTDAKAGGTGTASGDLSPLSPNRPQPWGQRKPSIRAAVPNVPRVPKGNASMQPDGLSHLSHQCENEVGHGKAPQTLPVPLVPPVPPENSNGEGEARKGAGERFAAWRVRLADGSRLRVLYCPDVAAERVRSDYPGAEVEPAHEGMQRKASAGEVAELRALIEAIYPNESAEEKRNLLRHVAGDPDAELPGLRELATRRTAGRGEA